MNKPKKWLLLKDERWELASCDEYTVNQTDEYYHTLGWNVERSETPPSWVVMQQLSEVKKRPWSSWWERRLQRET